MWVDSEGVCHSVALPDPTELMSELFVQHLDLLFLEEGESVLDLLNEQEDALFSDDTLLQFADLDAEQEFMDEPAPRVLLVASIRTIGDLRECIASVDLRWRLDAVLGLQDYLE